ncbi:MAG: type 1 glutamine amidotransferase [Lachnospiraceae bacterium]
MRLHYLQHVPFENPGSILRWADGIGAAVTSTQLYQGEPLPQAKEFDWLVVMGGPMNIYEEDAYPWLKPEKALIREAIEAGKVVLGLCLGAQLIADVLGGKVTKNPVQEIGWYPVRLLDSAFATGMFTAFPAEPLVFQWHGDTFSLLPPEVVKLAKSDACSNQAFSYQDRVFAFQFHLENTAAIIDGLLENCADELIPGPYVQSAEQIGGQDANIEMDNQWMEAFLGALYQKTAPNNEADRFVQLQKACEFE